MGDFDKYSDEELRNALCKYMDVVPPVTDESRKVLLRKLEKCIASEKTYISLDAVNGLKVEWSSPDKNESLSKFSFGSPTQKSSPIMEYVSRVPSYRRRSIHPTRPVIDDPYSELHLPNPVILNHHKIANGRSRGYATFEKNSSFIVRFIQGIFYVLIGLITVLLGSLCNVIFKIVDMTGLNRLTTRSLVCLLLTSAVCFLFAKFLFGDPFYHNPVDDLNNYIRV